MPQVPPVPTINPNLNFQQHAFAQGDVAEIRPKRLGVLNQLDDYRAQFATTMTGLNAAIDAINDELDARGITLDLTNGTPPVIPNLRVSASSSTSLTVAWDRPDESNVDAYLAYRRQENVGEPELIATIGPIGDFSTGLNTQTGLQPSTAYEITIRSRSPTGVLGAPSAVIGTTSAG